MKKRMGVTALLTLSLLMFLVKPIGAVNYGEIPQSNERTATQSYVTNFSDYSMKGLFSTCEQIFWVAKDWDVQSVALHLEYSATQLADTQLSSINVAVNDAYFYSFRPADNTGGRNGIDIYVPLGYLKAGYNNIRVDGYVRTEESLPCVDDVSEANWLNIFKESNISIQYDKNAFTPTVASFYNRFFEVDSVKNQESIFVISDSGNTAEMNTALMGIAGISNQTIYSDGYFPLLTLGNPAVDQAKNRIIIALYDQLPENFRGIVDGTEMLNEEDALLTIINEGIDKNNLVITAKNEPALINAGRLLGNPQLMKQLTIPSKTLEKAQDVETQVYVAETYIPFAGDQGTYYKGVFRQTKDFFVSYPANRKIANASEVYLSYRYSENLNFDRSLMSVYINDIPIGSRKLSQDKAGGDEATIPIPADIEIKGDFQLRVAFDLEVADLWCTLRQGEMPWAYLTPETMLKINSVATQDLIFENYPNPFVSDYSFNNVTLVVPDKPDTTTEDTLAKMFRVMGRFTKGNNGSLNVVHPDGMNESTIASNIIAIGSFQNNSFIQNNNENLYFKYNADGTTFLSNEKLKIDPAYGASFGYAQLIGSPYQKPGRAVLVVTSPSDMGLRTIGNDLGEMKNLSNLTGDSALADLDGKVLSYRFKDMINPTVAVLKQVSMRGDAQMFILVSVMVLALVIVGLVFTLRKNGIQWKKGRWKK